MKVFVFLFTVFFNIFVLNAQLVGTVIDGTKKSPLIGVNIHLQDTTAGGGMTDKNGIFEISFLKGIGINDTIVFSYVGYSSFKCTGQELNQLNYRVLMYEKIQQLPEVIVEKEEPTFFLNYTVLSQLPRPLYSFGGFVRERKIYLIAGDETTLTRRSFGKSDLLDMNASHKGKFSGTEACEYHSKDMFVFDIKNNASVIKKLHLTPRACHSVQLYNNKVFILGGKRYSTNRKIEFTDATMEIYDMVKDTLCVDPVNPHQAVDFTSFIYNDCLYVMGGAVKEGVFSDKVHTLDLKTGIWYELEDSIPAELCGRMNGILVGHKVYFFGGNRTTPMWTVTSYDLHTGEWQKLCDLKDSVSYPGLAANGNWIYIFENKNLQVYNVRMNTLHMYQFVDLNLESSGLFYSDGELYIVGGCIRDGIYITPHAGVYSVDVRKISIE